MKRRAFTLVELLVVIAIIALLIGLLLPAIGKARKSAIEAKSLSNLRSLAQMKHTYTSDYKEDWFNPFKYYAAPLNQHQNVCWRSIEVPPEGTGAYWNMAINGGSRKSEIFAGHWASLMLHQEGQGNTGLTNEVQFSPGDKLMLQRFRDFKDRINNLDDYIWDGSYFYSPTFWTDWTRYQSDTVTPLDRQHIARNKVHDVVYASSKVMLFERFDTGQDFRQLEGGGKINLPPTWNNPAANAKTVMADGSATTIRIANLNALIEGQDNPEQKFAFTPSGLWDPDHAYMQSYDMHKDGLEYGRYNGANTPVWPAYFWATKFGVRGRDINR